MMTIIEDTHRRIRQYGVRETLVISRVEFRHWWLRRRERALMWLVWRLPRELVMWACVRVGAHATTGKYSGTVVPELSLTDALSRWDADR